MPLLHPRCVRALAALAVVMGSPVKAAVSDPNFTESTFLDPGIGSFAATGMAWAPDGSGRLFIIRKGGFSGTGTAEARIVANGTLLTTPFATETVFTSSECGLIGMAFDPGFATNGYVYFFVTVSSSEQQIIRYTASGNTGTNRTVIVRGLPTRGANHDGGGLEIGRDGKIYWAVGDQGNRTGVDLNTTLLAAKVGRANRDGSVPADNPFVDGAGGNADYLWAGGLRNPYTLTVQPGTGALWVNVVGDGYEQIFTVERADNLGYDNVENGIPAGSPAPYARYITPVIKYRTNGTDTRNITTTGAVRSGNVVTITTTVAHGFRKGEKVTIAGVTDPSFNGAFFVQDVPAATTFTFPQVGPDASSGSPAAPVATATTLNIGGSLTGGTFLDTTAVPIGYRGNFFFGDYNSGRVIRSTLNTDNSIASVDYFATGNNMIDLAVGPDGALYGLQYNGIIRRWATQSPPGLIVTPTQRQTDEGARIAVTIRLATVPTDTVTVEVNRTLGDSDLYVQSGFRLFFTPSNWSTPQTVMIQAVEDSDAVSDTAEFSVTSPGLTTQTVNVFALDNDAPAIVRNPPSVTVPEGGSATFAVSLTGPPVTPVTLSVTRTGGDADLTAPGGSAMVFTGSTFSTPQTVTLSAAEDADATDGTATFTVSGTGLTSATVSATEQDNDATSPLITSSAPATAVINAPFLYDAAATGNPAPVFSLPTAPSGMGIDAGTGVITWTPDTLGSYPVTVRAGNGVGTPAEQTFSLAVVADEPPTASLTRPYEGEIVSGTGAEFFGDGHDDVRTVRGEFFINDVSSYTDTAAGGHYHIGGSHNLWNTTLLASGGHTVRMTVFDTAGQSGSVTRSVIVANGIPPMEAWKLARFSTEQLDNPAASGDLQDPDGDGLVNLLEYAFQQNPLTPAAAGPVAGTAAGRATVQFVRVVGATDLTYTAEAADSPAGPWSAAGLTLIATEPSGAFERVTYRDDAVPAGTAPRFLRVRVTRGAP
ncbi:MAG: PQQ-dependent sugar dehydrogenase [Terrimicrobiaceae bacterium]